MILDDKDLKILRLQSEGLSVEKIAEQFGRKKNNQRYFYNEIVILYKIRYTGIQTSV